MELDPQTLTHVVRAFSTYFSLINIVEEAFQHRQRRLQREIGMRALEVENHGQLWHQENASAASEMSGWRCIGSSSGSGR